VLSRSKIAVDAVRASNDLVSLHNSTRRVAPINRLPTAFLFIAPQKFDSGLSEIIFLPSRPRLSALRSLAWTRGKTANLGGAWPRENDERRVPPRRGRWNGAKCCKTGKMERKKPQSDGWKRKF
jgi:hypothetical protein